MKRLYNFNFKFFVMVPKMLGHRNTSAAPNLGWTQGEGREVNHQGCFWIKYSKNATAVGDVLAPAGQSMIQTGSVYVQILKDIPFLFNFMSLKFL